LATAPEEFPLPPRSADGVWGEEDAPSALDPAATGWASEEDAPRALAPDSGWAEEEPPSGLAFPDPVAGWSATDDAPRVFAPEQRAGEAGGPAATTSADGAWGEEDVPSGLGGAGEGWTSEEDVPRVLDASTAEPVSATAPDSVWEQESPSGLAVRASAPGWSAADEVPRVLAPEPRAGEAGGAALTTSADDAWWDGDAPSALGAVAEGWASDQDAPRVLAPDSAWAEEEPPSGLVLPDAVAGWSATDDAPRVLAPEQRPPGRSRRTNLPGQDVPPDARTAAQTNDRAATGAPRTAARSPRSTDSQAGDADARGDPDAPALHPAGSAASDSTSERENLARRPTPPAPATANNPVPADEPAERPDAETQPETGQGGDTDSSTTEDETRTYDTYEEVVTPNGTGYVVAQSPDGVLVNEGGTYDLYPAGRLSRPGEARPPEPVDLAGQERRAQDLAAAMSPEGLALRGHDARLARLNLDEGHGEVIDSAGEVIGWIRRRGRTWYGQDARGGIRSSTSWAEDSKGGPLRAAELMASFVVLGTSRHTMPSGQPFRHIRPEEVTSPIFYSMLSEAQTRELRTLAEEWKTVADPDLRTAAEQWSQEVSTAQMRRLATAVDEVAAHTDTTTPQGRRRQGVLQRLAANVRSQAHAAEGAFSTLPPPGEPDPWARPYRPQETQQAAATPTNTPKEMPAQPDTALQMPATVTTDEPSEDVADAPQPEATVAPQAIPGVPVASSTPESDRPSQASMPSRPAPPPLDPSAAPASTATSAPTAPEVTSEGAHPAPILPGAPAPSGPAAATAETPQPPVAATVSAPATGLADDWTLALPDLGAPHSAEAAATAWAMRGVLSDYVLIELMAAVDDDDAFARWKSRHMRYHGEGTGHVNKNLAPGGSVRHKHSAKHFEARIADQTVKVTWDRIRAWLREATTPEALSLLQAAEEAGDRLRGGKHSDSLLAATGELAVARDLRAQVTRLTTQVLDHVVQFMATTPVPTGRRGKLSARAAANASLFDLNEASDFDLPGAEQVRADLDRLIAYLPDPRADRESETVPLSALSAGMVLDRGDRPVVITEIIRHPGRCDIVGEFRGPIWPARIKHSVELSEQDPDPHITLAPLLPSLYELTGRQPEPADDETPGPLVEGHPALSAPAAPRARGEVASPLAPPVPRMPGFVWDEQRRRAHGQAVSALTGERPPLSARRRELDPDDPYAQFTDNLEHQLQQLADHPDEHAAVASAAREIRDTVADLAVGARDYSTERLRTAEGNPAELLQLTLEPSRTAPFVRVAMNAIMRALDTAEASVTSARAKTRVRAALAATVCSSPPHDPQGESARDFGDALVEFEAVASNEQDTVAELLAGPAQWAHFADMAARVEAATATPDPNPPAARFANLDEVRAHLADLAVRPLPDIEVAAAGLNRHELQGRAKYAGQLATNPTLELTPSRRLAIHGSANGGWHVVAPGSADVIVPWAVKSRRHALRYAALLERLTDPEGNAYPWDADDFPSTGMPYEPQGGHLLYDFVESNQSHHSLGFHHRVRILRERSQAYGWMEDLSLNRFSAFDYIHSASPADLQPGDEVMFTFDQDELTYAQSVAGYFPPPRVDNLAIGTAVVGENRELIPGFWWPERHPEQVQRLTPPVALRDGARRARPGEYTLHAGITAHLPELTAHQAIAATPSPTPASPESPYVESGLPAADEAPLQPLNPEPGDGVLESEGWSADAPSALAEESSVAPWDDDEVPPALPEAPGPQGKPAGEPVAAPAGEGTAAGSETAPATSPAPAETGEESAAPATDFEARWRERLAQNAAAGEVLGIDPSATEAALPRHSKERHQALAEIARGTISVVDGVFMLTNPRRPTRQAPSQRHFRTVLDEGLAQDAGGQVHLSERGSNWCTHHNVTLPAVPPDIETVDQAPLPPIDYAPLAALPIPEASGEAPLPPAPAPLPAAWHRRGSVSSEESIEATYAMAAEAAERAARSTARDVADIAAGPDHTYWTHQYPLAQYDENAAAALEALADPVAHEYATRAVLNLRAALEEAGKEATDHYVRNVRSPQWKTTQGVQADYVHRGRVTGIVVTYFLAVREHAEAYELDADSIVNVLEAAGGWTGELRQLGNAEVKYPQLPAAENVAEAAQYVANALRAYALGQTDTVDTVADRRTTWRTVEPRPVTAAPTVPAPEAPPARPASDQETVEAGTNTVPASTPTFPRLPQARRRALVDIAHGNITEVDDVFMKRTPQHTVERAYSQHAVTDVLALGLAERAGQRIQITEYGTAWLAHHNIKPTEGDRQSAAAPGKTVPPPIGSNAPAALPATGAAAGSPQPPARGPNEGAPTEAPVQGDADNPLAERQAQPGLGASDDAATEVMPNTDDATETGAAARTAANNSPRTQPTNRQETAQDQATQTQPSTDEQTLTQPTELPPGQGLPEALTAAIPIALDQAVEAPAPQTSDGPASSPATTGRTPAAPQAAPDANTQGGVPGVPTPLSETTPAPAGQDEEPGTPGTELEVPVPEAAATAGPGDRPVPATPGPNGPPRPPAAVREEGTVATSAPPGATTDAEPAAAGQTVSLEDQLDPETAAPYPAAPAYAAAHESLLAELDQHEHWLARTPAAAEAATTLASIGTLGLPGLSALLALQAALAPGTDDGNQRARLAQHLGHHIRCAQLTMAKIFLGKAARTSSTATLGDLHRKAFHGQFIAFVQQTEDGEMELGQYIQHRNQQITQQPARTEDPAEETPATAQEATTMAVDPDDDSQLPVFELPGESLMTAAEAAPRLLAQVQARLASGNPGVELLAHIHGRPVYALVDQARTSAPSLLLGLTAEDEGGSARAVTIPGDQLAAVTPEALLTAVTGWMNASDAGARPLLDYAPSAAAQTPAPPAPNQGQPTPAVAEQPTPAAMSAAAPAATTAAVTAPVPPAAEATTPQNPQGPAQPPASAAPEPVPAPPEPGVQNAPDAVADGTPVAGEASSAPESDSAEEQTAAPISSGASSHQPDSAAGPGEIQRQGRDEAQQEANAPAAPTKQPAEADPVDQLTALARSALTDLGVTLEATGVLTAPRTVVITLEASGNAERDRELAKNLRTALTEAIRQHPDRGLAAYRVDFQHTFQAGQASLPDAPSTKAAPMPRERLIAANNAAAKLFAERLQSDPNAELARTYLTEERQLPPEVQQEWGLGYAPSDRGAGRFDIMVRALRKQGFTDDELLHAGLAYRSRRDTLIDYFDDRIMFAIHDQGGDIVGFSGRRIDRPGETEEQAKKRQSQKYFNTSNEAALFTKGDMVFGLHHPAQAQALAGSSGPRVSVEGYLDVIAVARATAAVPLEQRPVVGAAMGTAFTERQLTVLRGLDTDNPRPHIVFLDADDSGRKVLLDKWDLLERAAGPTAVTTAPDAKDAAKLWEDGIKADGDGATPVLRALEQNQPLLDATVEAVLIKNADETERANHAFDSVNFFQRTRSVAAVAADYIHQTVQADHIHQTSQAQSLGHTAALEAAALTWAKRLHQEWSIPGHMTATAVLLGPGNHNVDYHNEVYEQALDLLAADPEGYFANDIHVRSRASAAQADERAPGPAAATAPAAADTRPAAPGQWPAGTRASGPVAFPSTTADAAETGPSPGNFALSMFLPSPVDGQPTEYTDRTTAAYALHTAVHERLGVHTTESPEPDRLPQPLNLGTVHGVDLGTSGDDQTGEDPTVVVWLGPSRSDSLRLSYSRFVEMTGPQLLAAVEWRAAQAAGLLGAPLSQTWRDAVRSIIPPQFPAQPTPTQLADLLDAIAQSPDGSDERIRHRAEQAVALYTAGHPALALNHLAANDHIWVLRNDGSWIQEEAPGTELSWEELDNGFSKEAVEQDDIAQAAAELPPADQAPMAADLTVAHHSAHEALAALRPYSIGLPGTIYEKITRLVAQMDAAEPAIRRLHGPNGEQLMNRAKRSFVRVLEGLATVASKIRLTELSTRLERTVARLRGQDPATLPAPRAVRTDRRMQDLAHIERDLERRMAAPTTTLAERGELQEQWIINRARWRARYEQLHGQRLDTDFLPDNGLVAGAPPVPNLIAAHDILLDRLATRVAELRDTDPHTGKDGNRYEPTADLFNGVAWAYQQRLIGIVPTGKDPQGPIPTAQLRQAALTVTSHQNASPLTLRRAMSVTAERADRLLHRLEEQQILGPYRADAPRTVLARPADIDSLLARPVTPPALRKPVAEPASTPAADPAELDEDRIRKMVSKILADQQKRSEPRSGAEPAERTAPAPRARKSAHREAEANALAAGQSTSLAPSQS